jgi:DNA polymerase-3 subunit beta
MKVTPDADALQQRAAILTNEKFRGVRGARRQQPEADRRQRRRKKQEEIEVDYTGDVIDVGFNVGYLCRRAEHHTEEIQWSFNDANQRADYCPGNDRFNTSMPMRI